MKCYYRKGIAHLVRDGKTLCGQRVEHYTGFAISQDATLTEFVRDVRPRCGSCRRAAQLTIALGQEEIDA